MIQARFGRHGSSLVSVEITGHAGFAEHGEDIVCASVTSALQLCSNGITEVLKAPATVTVEENLVRVTLPQDGPNAQAEAFLQALHLHLTLLQQDYSDYLTTTVSEV